MNIQAQNINGWKAFALKVAAPVLASAVLSLGALATTVIIHVNNNEAHLDAKEDRARDRSLAAIDNLTEDMKELKANNKEEHRELKEMIRELRGRP